MSSDESNIVEYNLLINCEMSYTELRKLETSLIRIMHYFTMFCGDKNIDKAVVKIERMIMLARSAQIMINALDKAMEADSPVGWLFAAVHIAGTVIMAAQTAQQMGQ